MKMMTRTVWSLAARMKFTFSGDKTAGIAYQPTWLLSLRMIASSRGATFSSHLPTLQLLNLKIITKTWALLILTIVRWRRKMTLTSWTTRSFPYWKTFTARKIGQTTQSQLRLEVEAKEELWNLDRCQPRGKFLLPRRKKRKTSSRRNKHLFRKISLTTNVQSNRSRKRLERP